MKNPSKVEAVIFLTSFLLRLTVSLVLFYIYGGELLSFANSDALGYISNGEHLAAGEGFRESGILSALRTPVYPLFLAGFIKLGLPLILFLPVIQALLFSLGAILLYRLGALLFSERVGPPAGRAGKIAGFIFALEPFMVVNTNLAIPETLFLFLLILFFYLFFLAYSKNYQKKSLLVWSGIVLGLVILTKPVALYLPFVVAIFIFADGLSRKQWKQNLTAFALVALALVLTIFPWSLRQKLVFGSWQLSNSGTYITYTRVLPIAVAEERGVSYEEASRVLLKEELPQKITNFDPVLMEHTFKYDEFLKQDAKERIAARRGAVFKFYLFSMTSGLFGTGYDYMLEDFGLERDYQRESFTAKLLSGDISGFVETFFRMDSFQLAVMAGGLFWLFSYFLIIAGLYFGLRNQKTRLPLLFIIMAAGYFVLTSLGPQARARYRVPSYPLLFLLVGFSLDVIMVNMHRLLGKLKISKKYEWLFDFIDYSKSRVVTGVIGTIILFIFADTMGYNAWAVNLAWIPLSFIVSFSLIRVYAKRMDKSTTGKLKKFFLKEDI